MEKSLLTARTLFFLTVSAMVVCATGGNFVIAEEKTEKTEISVKNLPLSGEKLQRRAQETLNRWKKVSDAQAEGAAREFLMLYRALEVDMEIPPRLRKSLTRSIRTKLDALSRQVMRTVEAEKPKQESERPKTVRNEKKTAEMGQFGGLNDAQNSTTQESGEELVEVIQTTIHPDSWERNGGNGTIQYWRQGSRLIIRQTDENHEEIQNLLNQLRRAGR